MERRLVARFSLTSYGYRVMLRNPRDPLAQWLIPLVAGLPNAYTVEGGIWHHVVDRVIPH